MRTSWLSIGLYLAASVLGAVGQFLYKVGADRAVGTFLSYVANPAILGGVACYVGVMILFVAGLRGGGSLTVLYPVYATTFIWASILARVAFAVPIKPAHAAGMALLILGMYLMGR